MVASLRARLQASWAGRGPLARLLLPLSFLYGLVVALRRWLYRTGLVRAERLPVPVVVVGNLIVGGAGKTPTVMAVVALLREQGWTPGVVSRGYGRSGDTILSVARDTPAVQCGDEPLLLALRTGAPVVVGRDRAGAGRELLRRHPEVNLVVADDGLQHWRLARDVQLIVFDERGAGNGWLLPAGPLRERVPAQVPPRTLVIYNAATPSTPWPGLLAQRSFGGALALGDWWAGKAPDRATIATLAGRPLVAAAGLARPGRFFDMLRAEGLTISELPLPDHHDYAVLPWPANTPDVILTEKDAVKLPPQRALGATRVWVARLDFRFDPSALCALLPRPPRAVKD